MSIDDEHDPEDGSPPPGRPAAQWIAMALAVAFLAGSLGFAFGKRANAAPSAQSVDVGFLQDMIVHHEQAIRLSTLELINGAEADVKVFAREILGFQSYEIGVMERQLEAWGHTRAVRSDTAMAWMDTAVPVGRMPGLASQAEMERLETAAGRDADALFIPLMQDHHRGGIHMAKFAAEQASSSFTRDLAQRMASNQALEIGEMSAARKRAGLTTDPPGYVRDAVPSHGKTAANHGEHS